MQEAAYFFGGGIAGSHQVMVVQARQGGNLASPIRLTRGISPSRTLCEHARHAFTPFVLSSFVFIAAAGLATLFLSHTQLNPFLPPITPSPLLPSQGAMTFHEKHLDALVSFFGSWVPLADKTVYLTVPGMDKALAPLGETLGFEIGMLKVRECGVTEEGGRGERIGVRSLWLFACACLQI